MLSFLLAYNFVGANFFVTFAPSNDKSSLIS
uniref:Uncharacterized protein n=1 Tax=Siphoviridae sp. ctdYc1 TaxID=2826399 RepID=A0A8S5N070_9CAUD|nr:MAG TPA: hypothetical protein [Siphoviridae sp. ctdYc1]